jgi:hypothetical protein
MDKKAFPYHAKDVILKKLIDLENDEGVTGIMDYKLAEETALSYYYTVQMIKELIDDNMLHGTQTLSARHPNFQEYEVSILPKGKVKYHYEGGYIADYRKLYWDIRKKVLSTLLIALNAGAVLILSYLSVNVADKTNQFEKKIDKLQDENDSLKELIRSGRPTVFQLPPANLSVPTPGHADIKNKTVNRPINADSNSNMEQHRRQNQQKGHDVMSNKKNNRVEGHK